VYSIFQTLYPAVIATLSIVLVSCAVAGTWFASNNRFVRWVIQVIGESLSAVPALFILFLALYVTQLHSKHQLAHYLFWIVLIESARGAYAYSESLRGWNQYKFLEGAVSVGRSNGSILFTHLRSWLGYFTLEFGFTEFARVLSLMAQLAAFHLYSQERIGYLPFSAPLEGVVSVHSTWLSMIGNMTADMLYIWKPYVLYVPVIFLVMVVGGVSLVAKGIRGTE
jgi:ABC-type dipeptide/oligopeptide/nickel transport system permease subunit